MKYTYFTSESVTDGHPDKICDQIADAILDEALRQDKTSKMAVEATIKDDFILVYGEANTRADIDYAAIAKRIIKEIGYNEEYTVMVKVNRQSPEIFTAVDRDVVSAGDQGIMFGYASNETDNYMPLPIALAHQLSSRLSRLKHDIDWVRPDGKTQVTVAYDENNHPAFIKTILVSIQHSPDVALPEIRQVIIDRVINEVVDPSLITEQTEILVNPSGLFTIGGSFGDSGTTGRKIVVDTYGGMGRIGGGCFSSKDPSKVDRSAAYYARYVAKNVVAHQLADRCEIQLSYAIGLSQPLSIHVDTFNTGNKSDEEILDIIMNNFDFSVSNIINELDLLKPIYQNTSNFGHFGRNEFTWEQIKPFK